MVGSSVRALDGLCRLVIAISLVRGRQRVPADFGWIESESGFVRAIKSADGRADLPRDVGQNQLVGRMFDQYFVARFQDRGHGQIIRHRRSGGRDDAIGWNAAMLGQRFARARIRRNWGR